MNDLIKSITHHDLILITAPPGWGKTYKLLDAIKQTGVEIVFIFPLRALCEEVYLNAVKKQIRTLNLKSSQEIEELSKINFQLILATPEVVFKHIELFANYLFVIDEYHLFHYWGKTFRYKMLECLDEIRAYGNGCVLLSATMNKELIRECHQDLFKDYKRKYHLDFGNQKIKNPPHKIYFYFKKKWILETIRADRSKGVKLIFCKYRNEVKSLEKYLKSLHFDVLSCVGGEAKLFMNELSSRNKLPDFIIATSVVSHGVNLPSIIKIYFLYRVENEDFYLQMLGRGGRDGSKFECYTMNYNIFQLKDIIKGFFTALVKNLSLKLKRRVYWAYDSGRNCHS